MSGLTKINIENLHYHIENGGPTVTVDYCIDVDGNGYTEISFESSYCDFPTVKSTFYTWGSIPGGDIEFLNQLGLMFIRAAGKIKLEKEEN